jgi:hypothetical protein
MTERGIVKGGLALSWHECQTGHWGRDLSTPGRDLPIIPGTCA